MAFPIIDPGELRHPITIRRKLVSGQSSYGEDVYTQETYHQCWAAIDSLQGREFQAVQQKWADARFRVKIRHKGGIIPAMTILWGSRVLDILDAQDPDNSGVQIIMYCREVST